MNYLHQLRLSGLVVLSLALASCANHPTADRFTVSAPFPAVDQHVSVALRSMERGCTLLHDALKTRRKDIAIGASNYAVWFWAPDVGNQFCTRYVDVKAAGLSTIIEVHEDLQGRKESVTKSIAQAFPNAIHEALPPIDLMKGNFLLAAYGHLPPP